MKRKPPAETELAQRRARRIRVVTTSTVAALVVLLLLAAAWLGATRMSVTPSVLARDPRILGTYLVPIDDAFELAAELRLDEGAAGETGRRLRLERGRFRHVLFGYGEIAFLEDGNWVVYVPTKLHTDTIRDPLRQFLDSTGVLAEAGGDSGGTKVSGEYHLLPDGVMVASRGLGPIPARERVPRGTARALLAEGRHEWRYATSRGYFPPELQSVADALVATGDHRTSETLLLWRGLLPSTVLSDPPAVEVHDGESRLLTTLAGPPSMTVPGALPLFDAESGSAPDRQ